MISFRIDWFDLLAVLENLKRLLQHHSLKASVLQHSAFFMVHLSHPYMTTGKTIALTRWTFVGKVMSLLFNVLSRLVIAFLPRSKCLFIFMAAVTVHSDFGPPKIKSVTVSTFSPSIYHEVMGPDASQKPEHFSFCQCSEILFNTLSVLIYLLLVKVSLYLHRLNPKDVAHVGGGLPSSPMCCSECQQVGWWKEHTAVPRR